MNVDDPDDRTVACAEYVLGTLVGADRDAFVARLQRDPSLQAEVGYWQDRLLGLARHAAPIEPSPAVWQRIDAAVRAAPASAGAAPNMSPAGGDAGPSPSTPVQAPPPLQLDPAAAREYNARARRGRGVVLPWERLGFWRAISGIAVAAAVLLAVLLGIRPAPVPETHYVAVLVSPQRQQAGWVVRASDRGPVHLVPLGDPGPVPAGRVWQFWTKGKDAAGPTSLGLVPADGRAEIPRDRLPDLGDEQLFEITLEPPDGSPLDRPTGPILFVGRANRV